MDEIHPLQRWLDDNSESVPQFAERSGLSFNILYRLISGDIRNPRIMTLQKIEAATSSKVTVRMLMDAITPREAVNG